MIGRIGAGGPCDATELVQEEDLVLAVDGADVRNAPLKEIQARVQGVPGTRVTLELQRGPLNTPHKVSPAHTHTHTHTHTHSYTRTNELLKKKKSCAFPQ